MTASGVGAGPDGRSGQAAAQAGPVRRALFAFRRWRRTRPFWGGLLVILGGAEILLSERAPLPIVIHIGLQGLAGYLVPVILVLCGFLLLFHPVQQTFYAILAILLSLGSWITSNLGGFFVGMLLGLIGGSMAFAWVRGTRPGPAPPVPRERPAKPPSEGLSLILPDTDPGARADDGASTGRAPAGERGWRRAARRRAAPRLRR